VSIQQFVFGESDDDVVTEGDDMNAGGGNLGRVIPLVSPANNPRRRAPSGSLESIEESVGTSRGFAREGKSKRTLPALSRKGLVARGPVI